MFLAPPHLNVQYKTLLCYGWVPFPTGKTTGTKEADISLDLSIQNARMGLQSNSLGGVSHFFDRKFSLRPYPNGVWLIVWGHCTETPGIWKMQPKCFQDGCYIVRTQFSSPQWQWNEASACRSNIFLAYKGSKCFLSLWRRSLSRSSIRHCVKQKAPRQTCIIINISVGTKKPLKWDLTYK